MEGITKKIILSVVVLLIIATIIGATASTIDTSADDLTQNARCENAGCFYNDSRGFSSQFDCTSHNVTYLDGNNTCATAYTNVEFPMESLFNTGGIVILLFLAGGLIITLVVGFRMWTKR